jgi:biotin operon repressor
VKTIHKILRIDRIAHKKKFDTLYVITGGEGMGKSNLLLNIYEYWTKINKATVDVAFIALTPKQFVNAVAIADNTIGFVGFDEAGDGLLNRDAMNDFNKDMVKMYIVIRGKGLMTFLVLPSFWYLDKFFRMHRVKGLFHVYGRGKVAYWNKNSTHRIAVLGEDKQDIWCVRPNAYDNFPIYRGSIAKEYGELKAAKIKETIENAQKKYAEKSGALAPDDKLLLDMVKEGMPKKLIGETLGISLQAVYSRMGRIKQRGHDISTIKGLSLPANIVSNYKERAKTQET